MKIKLTILLLCLLLFSCNNQERKDSNTDAVLVEEDSVTISNATDPEKESSKEFSNERFRDVTIEKLQGDTYRVQGEAQVFEATFNWVVEDGHYVLKDGHSMTDAGAPEWGKFDFSFDVKKKEDYSTLLLILFEVSAKDGNHKYELPIPLP